MPRCGDAQEFSSSCYIHIIVFGPCSSPFYSIQFGSEFAILMYAFGMRKKSLRRNENQMKNLRSRCSHKMNGALRLNEVGSSHFLETIERFLLMWFAIIQKWSALRTPHTASFFQALFINEFHLNLSKDAARFLRFPRQNDWSIHSAELGLSYAGLTVHCFERWGMLWRKDRPN